VSEGSLCLRGVCLSVAGSVGPVGRVCVKGACVKRVSIRSVCVCAYVCVHLSVADSAVPAGSQRVLFFLPH
jgi:hypothetical protein